jgi:hypothetical protein
VGQGLEEAVEFGLAPTPGEHLLLLLNNILPLRARLPTMGAAGDGVCPHCGEPEDIVHFFQRCVRVSDLGDGLYYRVATEVLCQIGSFLMLNFSATSSQEEHLLVAHLGTLVSEVWEARHSLRLPSRQELVLALRCHFPGLRYIF